MELDELIRRYQQGDVKAFEELYNNYSSSVKSIIYCIVRNEEDVEEILQDVFVKVWENADKYTPKKGRFYTWLINISRNTAIDKVRSKKFKIEKQNLCLTFFVDALESVDNLENRVDAIGIRSFINKMPEDNKNLIERIYFKGYTQKEISEETNTPLGTIKTNLRKCLMELRLMLID